MTRSSSLVALGLPFWLASLSLTGCPQSVAPTSTSTSGTTGSPTTSATTSATAGTTSSSGGTTGVTATSASSTGTDGTSTSGTSGTSGTDSTGGTGSTGTTGGTSSSASSGSTGNALRWYTQAIPQGSSTVTGIWGTSPQDIYAVTGNGQVLHSAGSTWTQVFQSPSNLGFNAVYVSPGGSVWAAGEAGLFECTHQCDQGNFAQVTLPSGTCFGPTGVCGVGEDVYAACDHNGAGYLLERGANGGDWGSQALGAAFSVTRCYAVQNGTNVEVLVAAQSKVFRSSPLGITEDTIHFPSGSVAAYAYFSAVWGVGSTQLAAAPGGRLFSWNGSAWDLTSLNTQRINSQEDDGFQAIVGTDSTEIFALGSELSQASDKDAYFDGSTWTATSAPVSGQSYWSGWSPSPSDYYLGGNQTNTNEGFIVRGHR